MNVIILAAGSLKHNLRFINYTFDSPALVPINMGTVASNIIEFYQQQMPDCNIYLAVNEKDLVEVQNELQYYLKDIHLLSINLSSGINDTLCQVLQKLNSIDLEDDVIINPVTTIPTQLPKINEVFISNETFQNSDFSLILTKYEQIIFRKKSSKSLYKANAFTGIFRVSFFELIKAINKVNDKNDLLEIVQIIHRKKQLKYISINWIDCGHDINYFEAKAKLITSRSFNNINVDTHTGLIKKRSSNNKKFINEINFTKLLPSEVQIFFPRIVDTSFYSNQASATMEYYSYPTMAEYMLYWDLSDAMWEKAFSVLQQPLNVFQKYKFSIGIKAYKSFYIDKLNSRIQEFKSQLPQKNYYLLEDEFLIINNEKYKNIKILKDKINRKLKSLYSEDDFCIMHGDYCFNNILYDYKSGIIRLIDARGSFGEQNIGIYGDIKYDLAKLTHSVIGKYDYFIAKLYKLEFNANKEISLQVLDRQNYNLLKSLNINLINELGFSVNNIMFLTALLFLSMCPLHADDTERQKALYIQGIILLNETLNKMELK